MDLSDDANIKFDAHGQTILRAHFMATKFYMERIGHKWHDKEAKEFLKKSNEILNTPELYNDLKEEVVREFNSTLKIVKDHNIKDTEGLLKVIRSQGFPG